MNVLRTTAVLSATTAAFTGLVLISPAANASGGPPDVRSSGTCTVGATWKLKAKPDLNPIYTGTRKTVAPSGSFTVAMLRRNLVGADTIRASAVNTVNGSVCGGQVVL